jgi:uncharacterized protein (DUF362 family)
MPKVIVKHSFYEYSELKPHIFAMLGKLSGSSITSGSKVIIKPNFLAPARPESAIITHPLIIRAVAEYVIEMGAKPVISDSQAVGSFNRILQQGGYIEALRGLDCEFGNLKNQFLSI